MKQRPKNLNLLTIKQPIPAIVSILHRISGFLLILIIPFFLWAFNYSLTIDGYEYLQDLFSNPFIKFLIWLFLIPYCYHLVAGIRHLILDLNLGVTLRSARLSATLVILIAIILIIIAGIWLW